ncbi:MAG: hypothetical protein NVSMB2_14490 [Chloroflexota bacterium]
MTFPDPNLDRPGGVPGASPGNHQDIIPPTERGQDPERERGELDLARDPARPLTDAEKRAAAYDDAPGERVYAPASERVPKPPVPGHRDFVEHTDTHTPEREAAGASVGGATANEPAFARIPRPSVSDATTGAYASPMSNPGLSDRGSSWSYDSDQPSGGRRKRLFLGIGASWSFVIIAGVGTWLFVRWRHERNKPINRLRRQAQSAVAKAADLRERLPEADDAAKPAVGLGTALVSILLLVWRQSRDRREDPRNVARKQAARVRGKAHRASTTAGDILSDTDWQKRLTKLKERWSPSRVELEKVSISRH